MKTIKKDNFLKVLLSAIIVEKGFNIRTDLGDIDALAKSIAKLGQQVPIIATPVRGKDEFVLTAGHRRMAAIHLANDKYGANIDYVNVMKGSGNDQERLLVSLLDGEGAKRLTTSELATGFARLKEMGMKPKEIGENVGVSQAQVYNILAVAKAPQIIQKMVEVGDISVALVNEIQRTTKDVDEQIKLAQDAVKNAQVDTPATNGAPKKKKKATSSNAKTSKVSADVKKLEKALALADPTSAKAATLKAIVNKLKNKATAEDIAKLLK